MSLLHVLAVGAMRSAHSMTLYPTRASNWLVWKLVAKVCIPMFGRIAN